MNSYPCVPRTYTEGGFVLVTSLIFLVVITLLAVSAINSSTIQERMASNMREKSRARQAADAGLRHGELLLRNPLFDTQRSPGDTVAVENTDSSDGEEKTDDLKVWRRGDMLPDAYERDSSQGFLDKSIWGPDQALAYVVDPTMPPVELYIEDYECISRDLNPDNRASCHGSLIYRVTARAKGQNPAAVAVTQSLYEKRY